MPAAYGPLFYQQNRRTAYFTLAAFTLVVMRPWEPSVTSMTIGLLRIAVGPLPALYFDTRRRLMHALVERAERAERERHPLAEPARAEERARLAGEMHDVVTHRVSLMVLQAGALKMTAWDEATRRATEELCAAGCQALEELRDLGGILRTAPEGGQTPSVAVADLVAESVVVGIPTELIEEGDSGLASPVVGRTAHRVLREALTHVRKHAPGARVRVRVEYDNAHVRLTVRNTPPRRGDAARLRPDLRIGGVSVARVAVVDDEPMVCRFLRTILGSAPDIEVVDEAVRRSRPDVILMDLCMPGMDGLTAIEHINALADPPNIVVLTTFDADQYVLRALRAGATGFLVKSTPPEELIGLVRAAAQGHTVLSLSAARRLIAASTDSLSARDRAREPVASLTEREVQVLAGLGEGLSNAQIAARLYLSEATIKGCVSRMLDKLGCVIRTQAGLLAHDTGIAEA